MMTSEELRNALAKSLAQSRQKSGLSMNRLAGKVGVSDKTIAAWEWGKSCPNVLQYVQTLNACGVPDIMRVVLEVLYPDIYEGVTSSSGADEQREALSQYISRSATDKTVKQLFFLILGAHGSNFIPQLQELVIHDSLPLESRILLAEMMLTLFEMNSIRNAVDVPDPDLLPNMDLFLDGIAKAKEAVMDGQRNYVAIVQ